MSPSERAIVLAGLIKYARPEILKDYIPSSCLESSRIAILVARHFGMAGHPLSVQAEIYNPQLADAIQANPRLFAGKAKEDIKTLMDSFGGWCIVLGHTHETIPGKWDGHLVACIGEYLVDLSLDQANRPERNMSLGPLITKVKNSFLDASEPLFVKPTNSSGCVIRYTAVPKDDSFEQLTGYIGRAREKRGIVERICFRIERLLENRKGS